MKLYLSSSGVGNHLDRLHQLVGANKRMLYIDNAKDYLSSVDRAQHVREKQQEYEAAGFLFEELDLRDYFGKSDALTPLLEKVGLLWAGGGNTFILRRAMQYAGLDTLLQGHKDSLDIVYGGSSAGSIVVTPSLRGTELGDDPYDVPQGYYKNIVWDGLKLTDTYVVPHIGSPWFDQESCDMEQYMKDHKLDYIPLRDGEVYVVEGDQTEKLV